MNMSKSKTLILSLATAGMLFSGCADKTPQLESTIEGECVIEGIEAKPWVCGATNVDSDFYADTGSAPMNKMGFGFTKREAVMDARSNLAQQIQTDVKDKMDRFMRSTGLGNAQTSDKVVTAVTKQVAHVTLKGSKQTKLWQTPNTVFVMVTVGKDSVNETAMKAAVSSFKNDDALWQQFQAKQGLEGLEKEFK